ncbi:uncharacterized protein LOC111388703 [Olea europaea var. sylvestris]|uniref:uncharacterized protein LOC111388703 n=1 Tax=Olea europaea var. sylvestris TaxID=158386 RepID=UPI000C1D76F4|nr:uncharacterized protein LOC111388703 [Olea europaea var. sylvestris]
MTVAEYQMRFIELSKYAQVFVSNEIDKCRCFENGLREEIRSAITAANRHKRIVENFDLALRDNQLYDKFNKYEFWLDRVVLLEHAISSREFMLTSRKLKQCDASRQGLGCVLMQNVKVTSYASRQLNKHELSYPTHDLEPLAAILALKI